MRSTRLAVFNLLNDPTPLIQEIDRQAEKTNTNYDVIENHWVLHPDDVIETANAGFLLRSECWEEIEFHAESPTEPNAPKNCRSHYNSVLVRWTPFLLEGSNEPFFDMRVYFCDLRNVHYDELRLLAEAVTGLRAVGEIRLEAI